MANDKLPGKKKQKGGKKPRKMYFNDFIKYIVDKLKTR
jgi:hypothetical protein